MPQTTAHIQTLQKQINILNSQILSAEHKELGGLKKELAILNNKCANQFFDAAESKKTSPQEKLALLQHAASHYASAIVLFTTVDPQHEAQPLHMDSHFNYLRCLEQLSKLDQEPNKAGWLTKMKHHFNAYPGQLPFGIYPPQMSPLAVVELLSYWLLVAENNQVEAASEFMKQYTHLPTAEKKKLFVVKAAENAQTILLTATPSLTQIGPRQERKLEPASKDTLMTWTPQKRKKLLAQPITPNKKMQAKSSTQEQLPPESSPLSIFPPSHTAPLSFAPLTTTFATSRLTGTSSFLNPGVIQPVSNRQHSGRARSQTVGSCMAAPTPSTVQHLPPVETSLLPQELSLSLPPRSSNNSRKKPRAFRTLFKNLSLSKNSQPAVATAPVVMDRFLASSSLSSRTSFTSCSPFPEMSPPLPCPEAKNRSANSVTTAPSSTSLTPLLNQTPQRIDPTPSAYVRLGQISFSTAGFFQSSGRTAPINPEPQPSPSMLSQGRTSVIRSSRSS